MMLQGFPEFIKIAVLRPGPGDPRARSRLPGTPASIPWFCPPDRPMPQRTPRPLEFPKRPSAIPWVGMRPAVLFIEDDMPTYDEIFQKVQSTLVDALGVDEEDVTRAATLRNDLGAESIDL